MRAKTLFPLGFRFHPTDVELVYYLKRKVTGKPFQFEAISEIDVYKFAPWDLPDKSCLPIKDLEWYFFCPLGKKYPNGRRINRTTDIGHWKTTGKDRAIIHNSRTVGMKKTLIFHIGKPPRGDRTDWVMYEYRLEDKELVDAGYSQDAYVLCKIFQKSGPGPKIGEQYGAPFNEEDWEDDTVVENGFLFPRANSPKPLDDQPFLLEPICQQSVTSGVCEVSSTIDIPDDDGMLLEELAEILIGSSFHPENANVNDKISSSAVLDENEVSGVEIGIYDELEDLSDHQTILNDNLNYSFTINNEYGLLPMLSELGSDQYMELNDLFCLQESDPSDLVVLADLPDQYALVENPNFLNSNNMHDDPFSVDYVTTGVVNDPLPVGSHMIDDQSTLFLELEELGRSMPQASAPAPFCEAEDDETMQGWSQSNVSSQAP